MSDVKLKPTYWRTCRALANEDRLRLFKAVVENEGRFSVRQYARLLGLQDDVASVYLRQMNARGLLGVTREHIKVFYNLNRDRSLPQAAELQKALATYMRGNLPADWEDILVRIFKGFTHFNRLAIIARLAKGKARREKETTGRRKHAAANEESVTGGSRGDTGTLRADRRRAHLPGG